MSQNVDFPKFNEIWVKIKNEKMKERFLSRNTTVQVWGVQFFLCINDTW